jgi:protein tyrosine phosphatase (PTP) superfamily phosphohydrolase (DUF442 family)
MRKTRSLRLISISTLLALAASALVASVSAADQPIVPADVKGPMQWGTASHVTQLRRLYFADQPDQAGLEAAKAAGVAVVINMRAPSEMNWDEGAAATKLGMQYYDVPVSGPTFDRAQFERIESIVAEHPDDEILIHCGSSNRAGGWLATHLVTRHHMSESDALAVGRKAGITKRGIEKRVHAYLETNPQSKN